MTFELRIESLRPEKSTLHLQGRLDALTFGDFDKKAESVLAQMAERGTVVLDLSALNYISSAGLRSIAKIRKVMRARNGQTLILNPQVQVRKVFDIVKATPLKEIFANEQELDDYLARIQQKVLSEDDGD
ncbi:STAS domain-containing protein [Dyella sp. 2HG41-7]|uniref:STAS domain-containing protein n=1 Tax=Dyella sp. 2HG41-7 TaxID=2883239 RepID=UPI00210465E1|nr:STAS domain-containing protein [Dyella sp. 2HG41-7]